MTVFEKVSPARFAEDGGSADAYDGITLPARATAGSAGYDFFAPEGFSLAPGEEILVPTGIRCRMDGKLALFVFPRSGLGFRYSLMLNNTVGIIDPDYYNAANEGHILVKMTNRGGKTLTVEKGKAFAQGVFLEFFTTDGDSASGERKGGFGSTG